MNPVAGNTAEQPAFVTVTAYRVPIRRRSVRDGHEQRAAESAGPRRPGDGLLDAIEAMVRALPALGGEIRRQARQDGGFLAICEDYRDAVAALAHHRAGPGADAALAEEYRVLADELVAEAAGRLNETRTDTEEHDG